MRFSDRITFIWDKSESYYDPDTGQYTEPEIIETIKPCNIGKLGLNRQVELFGDVKSNITIARLQKPYSGKFDRVVVNGKKYHVMQQSSRRKGVLFLEGGIHE